MKEGAMITLVFATAALAMTVVLHVDDGAGVAARPFDKAKTEVERIYTAAGITIVWGSGTGPAGVGSDGRLHLVVAIRGDAPAEMRGEALGAAFRPASRAYVYLDAIAAMIARSQDNFSLALGHVIAHEVGHLLLPPNSHSSSGIMRAEIDLRRAGFDRFTDEQAAMIRRYASRTP
jgi:hypothetical protein